MKLVFQWFICLFQELWDTNNIWGSGRRQGSRVEQVMWVPFPASRNRDESSAANKQSKQQQQPYIPLSWVEGRDNSSSGANPKAHTHHTNHTSVHASFFLPFFFTTIYIIDQFLFWTYTMFLYCMTGRRWMDDAASWRDQRWAMGWIRRAGFLHARPRRSSPP